MVKTSTFVIMLLVFFISMILSEKYLAKNNQDFTMFKAILILLIGFFTLLTIVVLLPVLFPVLIYGSVALGAVVCVYMRHRLEIANMVNDRKGKKL